MAAKPGSWCGVASDGWRDRQKLVWRGTFIEVLDYDGEGLQPSAEQGRPLSAPPALRPRLSSVGEGAADVFQVERAYVQALSDSAIWVNGSEDHEDRAMETSPQLPNRFCRTTPRVPKAAQPRSEALPGRGSRCNEHQGKQPGQGRLGQGQGKGGGGILGFLKSDGVVRSDMLAQDRESESSPAWRKPKPKPASPASSPRPYPMATTRAPIRTTLPKTSSSSPVSARPQLPGAQSPAADQPGESRHVPPLPLPFPPASAKVNRTSAHSPSGPFSASSSNSASTSTNPPATFSNQACPNPGSFAHPDMCARPCMYIVASNCANGASCEFCHLDHTKRPARLEKRHRDWLRNMRLEDSVAIILPVIQSRVLSLDSSFHTQQVLEEFLAACRAQGCAGRAENAAIDSNLPNNQVQTQTQDADGESSLNEASRQPAVRPSERVQRSERRLLTLLLRSMNLRTLLLSLGRLLDWPDSAQIHSLVTNLVGHLRVQPPSAEEIAPNNDNDNNNSSNTPPAVPSHSWTHPSNGIPSGTAASSYEHL